MTREKLKAVRTVLKMNIVKTRGRPKNKRLNAIKSDMRTVGMFVDDVKDRVKWRFRI